MKYLISLVIIILATGCTINLQIDTDYASQNGGGGSIEEEVTTEAVSSITPTTDLEIDSGAL